jgi:hypothetical protein
MAGKRMTVLVIVPIRKRPQLLEHFIDTFEATAQNSDLIFVRDGDDDSYDGFDFRGHGVVEIDPRATVVQKLNETAKNMIDNYDHFIGFGDDCEFVTKGWDVKLVSALNDMGGSGWVYANNGRRTDIPEAWLVSADVVKFLGWYAYPHLCHYYVDNVISDLGKRSDLIRFVPDVSIPHHHYSVPGGVPKDELYSEAEQLFGQRDLQTYQQWRGGNLCAADVSRLRREFNPDVKWILTKV